MSRGLLTGLVGLVAVTAVAVLYGMGAREGNTSAAGCAADASRMALIDAAIFGEVAAFQINGSPAPFPAVSFKDEAGAARTLDDWRGKVTLVNLWATWCAPCVEEMPDLDALKAAFDGTPFDVVAVSLDRGEPEVPRDFLAKLGIAHLDFYHDQTSQMFRTLRDLQMAPGLPTTYLIDEQGCTLGLLAGAAKWDSDDALELIRAALPS